MINFFRNNDGKFINVLAYYIVGPALLLIFLYKIVNNPSGVFDITPVRGRYETTLILGIVGLLLTAKGIVRLIKKRCH